MRGWVVALGAALLAACGDGTQVAPGGDGGLDAGTNDGGSAADAGPGWWTGPAGDLDGDGVTAADGDCDDGDPAVYPGAEADLCDGLDNDCDGTTDEDFDGDGHEPNDVDAVDLGDLTDAGQVVLYGWLFPETDVDRFRFYVSDEDFTWFDVETWLYGVPETANLKLELRWVADASGADRGVVATADEEGFGGYELINYGGVTGEDDTGWYEVAVSSMGGSGCRAPYTLHLVIGSL